MLVDFDCPEDLDYLGVRSYDIGRNIWFLTKKGLSSIIVSGYLRSSVKVFSPTSKLIDEIESGNNVDAPQLIGATVTQTFHLHGPNSRVNMNSTDNSLNVASVSNDDMFVQMLEVAESIRV